MSSKLDSQGLTPIFFAAPPKPRDKARWLNLDSYLNWAEKMLAFADRKEEILRDESDADAVDWEKFEEKFGWLREFRLHLREWRTMLDLLQAAKDEIKRNGLRLKSVEQFEKAIPGGGLWIPATELRLKRWSSASEP